MALLETYTDANKVQNLLPSEVRLRTLIWINGIGYVWQVEVITRESFDYVGLSKTAAAACMADMVDEYTVQRNIPIVVNGEVDYTAQDVLTADVSASPMGGRMWRVNVDVNDRLMTFEMLHQQSGGGA